MVALEILREIPRLNYKMRTNLFELFDFRTT